MRPNPVAAVLTSSLLFLVSVSGCKAKKNCAQSGMGPPDLYRNGVMNPNYMWYRVRNKVQVPVVLDPDYSYKERKTILGGLAEIQYKTCIDFYVFNDTHALDGYDFVYITKARTGCWSHIGRVGGGAQELSLGKGCVNHRTAVHEMIHALGFAHEHVRSDRDNYVYVFWQNISPGRESNFAKRNTKSTDPYGPYDYASIMHYDRRAFSHNGMDTLKPLKHGAQIGVGQSMSAWDVKKLLRMYNCGGQGHGGGGRGQPRGHHRPYHSNSLGHFTKDNKLEDLEDDQGEEEEEGQDFHDHHQNSVNSYQPRGFQERDPYFLGYHHRTLTFDEDRTNLAHNPPFHQNQPHSHPHPHHLYNNNNNNHHHHTPSLRELATPFFDNFSF